MRSMLLRFGTALILLLLIAQTAMAATLEKGSSGSEVTRLQQALNALGYAVSADGVFGTQTRNAVKTFQADHQLKVDGKAGSMTQSVLYTLAAQKGQSAAPVAAPAATSVPAQSGTRQAQVYCSDGGKLNLRAGAGSGYRTIDRIPTGDYIIVLEDQGKWSYVSYNGETGYVMSSFLRSATAATTVPAAAAPTAAPVTANAQQAVVSCADGGKLNLRSTPGSGAQILERIPNGTQLAVVPANGKWYQTVYNGQSGYVLGSFLSFQTGAAAPTPTAVLAVVTPTPTAVPAGTLTATVHCNGSLNLRGTASSNGAVIAHIPSGALLAVQPVNEKWYATVYNGQNGYVMAKFLQVSGGAVQSGGTAQTGAVIQPSNPSTPVNELRYEEFRYATVSTTGGGLNVRKGPGETYARVSEIRNGTEIVIRSIEGGWCAMYYGDIQGYVQRQYLNISAASGASAQQPATSGGTYDTSVLNRVLRSGYTGQDVNLVQQRLVTLKYLSGVSGVYDAATIEAVRSFQKINSLTADGLAGPGTFSALFSDGALEAGSAMAGSYSTYEVDYNGNTSAAKTAAVRRAQTALRELHYNVPLTGAFEGRTHVAIVAFQLRNGLTASGVLDAATQKALYSGSAKDAASPSRYYLPAGAGTGIAAPGNVQLLHWNNEVSGALSGARTVTAYDPGSGLSWKLSILSRGRHLDTEPATLEDTLIQKKAFGTTSWDVHPVYIQLPDGRWSLATMHDYPHGVNTIKNNGFGGQNCVHFLRDMSEAKKNDPNYGVQNQEALRAAWYAMTGITVTN